MEVGNRADLLKKKYPAKLLLFGEHLVLNGASSLAIPFHRYSAYWTKGKSSESLDDFYIYLSSLPFVNQGKLKILKSSGYYLESNIPRGYGLGSSGALCAAVYEFTVDHNSKKLPSVVIRELSIIEDYFHGKSSGLDAYVILMNRPIILKGGIPKHIDIDIRAMPLNLYLIDSGQSRNSKDLISKFVKEESHEEEKKELVRVSDKLIKDISNGNYHNLLSLVRLISQYQYDLLNYTIVGSIKPLWEEGLESNTFSIKLCGAGGGGFYLGFGNQDCFNQLDMEKILVN